MNSIPNWVTVVCIAVAGFGIWVATQTLGLSQIRQDEAKLTTMLFGTVVVVLWNFRHFWRFWILIFVLFILHCSLLYWVADVVLRVRHMGLASILLVGCTEGAAIVYSLSLLQTTFIC